MRSPIVTGVQNFVEALPILWLDREAASIITTTMCSNHPYRFSVANLAHRGKRVRLVLGIVGTIATLLLAGGMILEGVHPLWRWVLLLPAFGSILCILEAFTSTCVVLAVLGAWDLGCGTEKVPDPRIDAALRARAWKLIALSGLLAFLLVYLATRCGWQPA